MDDITKERAVKKHRVYYHVSHVKNVNQIKKEGLRADEEGLIFVFTDMIVSDTIAQNQCGLMDEYAVFIINSRGITGKVIMDRVAEFSAPYQRIIIQDKIPAKHVNFLATLVIDPDEPTDWDILLLKCLEGLSKKEANNAFYEKREFIKKEMSKRNPTG